MGDHSFLHPEYLWALAVALPVVAGLWLLNFYLRKLSREKMGDEAIVSQHTRKPRLAADLVSLAMWLTISTVLVGTAAMIVAPAAPQRAKAGTTQVVNVIDASKSARAEDYRDIIPGLDGSPGRTVVGPHGSRMLMVKHQLKTKLLPQMMGNDIAIVTYQGDGWPLTPCFSDDTMALKYIIDRSLDVGRAPGAGSDISYGMLEAVKFFEDFGDPKKDKVLILWSDGGFTGEVDKETGKTKEQRLAEAMDKLSKMGVRVIIVGVGLEVPIRIPVYGPDRDGKLQHIGWLRKRTEGQMPGAPEQGNQGEPELTAYEPGVLKALANRYHCEYFHLRHPDQLGLEWTKALAGTKVEERVSHVYQLPLGIAMTLMCLLFVTRALLKRRDTISNQG